MYKIQVFNKISQKGLELLGKDKYILGTDIQEPDGILVRSQELKNMDLPSSLKAIARAGVGVNNIPIDSCSEKGIIVFNTPGANANAVKELTICGLLLASRKIIEGIEWTNSLSNEDGPIDKKVEQGKKAFKGGEIKGKRLGVIGLGAIGVLVANAAHSLDMEVLGYDPFMSIDSAWNLSRGVDKAESLQELLEKSDFITIHVPLLEQTKYMIGREEFSLMKRGVKLLNFSRNELINVVALKEAIEEGIVAKYVTDFPEEKILGMDEVLCVPHLGASTAESEENCAIMAVNELKDYLENGNIRNSVNYPECVMPRRSPSYRISIVNHNIPNMVGQITTLLADAHINIDNLLNKSKGKYAYTLLDVAEQPTKESIDSIENIEGIIRVRVL